jgi:hypothetical protein
MVSADYLAAVKKAIGASAPSYDADVADKIEEARAEMARIGVAVNMAEDEADALIRRAVTTFVHAAYPEDEASAARYAESAERQMAMLSVEPYYKAV